MLAYLFLSKVATLTQSNSLSTIFPYIHSVSLQVSTVSTAIFAGIEAFAGNRIFADLVLFAHHQRLNAITCRAKRALCWKWISYLRASLNTVAMLDSVVSVMPGFCSIILVVSSVTCFVDALTRVFSSGCVCVCPCICHLSVEEY